MRKNVWLLLCGLCGCAVPNHQSTGDGELRQPLQRRAEVVTCIPEKFVEPFYQMTWATDHQVALMLAPDKSHFAFLLRGQFKPKSVEQANGWARTINYGYRDNDVAEQFIDIHFLKLDGSKYIFQAHGTNTGRRFHLTVDPNPDLVGVGILQP